MVTFVLDASAVLRFLDQEAGADRMSQILKQHASGDAEAILSAMHLGEIVGIFYRRHGIGDSGLQIAELHALALTVIPVTGERAERCARIKAEHGIPYVDALAVELATDTPNSVLVTADFDMKPAEASVNIEFLPAKQRRSS